MATELYEKLRTKIQEMSLGFNVELMEKGDIVDLPDGQKGDSCEDDFLIGFNNNFIGFKREDVDGLDEQQLELFILNSLKSVSDVQA